MEFFIKNVSDTNRVRGQNPIRISDYNEPIPDVILADLTKYDGKRHPHPAETLLIVEVSDSTLKYDRDTKLALYAEAEIPEVWIVNLKNDIIEVHQNPSVGLYQVARICQRGETVKSARLPSLEIAADKILG